MTIIDRRIKVVYIISNIDKAIAFEWIDDNIDKNKFDLSFILLNSKPSYFGQYLTTKGSNFIELDYQGKKSIVKVFFQVYKILRKIKPDVIHTHLVDADIIGLAAGKLLGIKKRIYTRHNSNYHKKYHKGAQKFDKFSNMCSTNVASISKNVSSILIDEEGVSLNKVRLIYHGFDLEKFANVPTEQVDSLISKYNPNRKGPVIGVISRYMHWKGIHYIIPAFKRLLVKYPDAYLILANAKKGDYKEEIKALLSEIPNSNYCEIEFEHNLFALYQLLDIFVHVPIDEEVEAFGQIYVEALAAGIPSVVSLSGISREFICHDKNAFVVPFKETDPIYDGIVRLLEDKNYREAIIDNGKVSVMDLFSLDKMIKSLEELYSE